MRAPAAPVRFCLRGKSALLRATCSIALLSIFQACSREPASQTADTLQVAPVEGGSPETRPPHGIDYKPAFEDQTRAPGLKTGLGIDVEVVARGLHTPWSFEFLPDGRILLTEREGRLRIVGKGGWLSAPASGLPPVEVTGQGGLLDVAVDPHFETNRTIYWSYSEPRKGGNGTALAKGVLKETDGSLSVENVQVIFRQQPTFASDAHFGSRIVITSDDKLFLTLGEREALSARVQSQDLQSDFGKIVRLNLDGTIPADNPFVGRSPAWPEIWSYGHRNVQAATLDPSGRLWTIEHGPSGGDELNQPKAGLNYGWPTIGYGIEYSGEKVGAGITALGGMEQPVYYWDPVIAPSGMIFYTGDLFREWRGDIFVGGLGSMKLVRLKLDGDKVVGEEWLLQERGARIRDVKQGSDGAIYVIADGGHLASLLRLSPKVGN